MNAILIRKTLVVLMLVLVGTSSATPVLANDADRIISRYLKAIGGHGRLLAIHTLRMTGVYHEGDLTANTSIEWKRPNFRRVTVGDPGSAYLEGYNGTSWEFSEPDKRLKLTAGTAAEAVARRGAEFDESIVDYKAKGYQVKLLGREQLLGNEVFHIEVVLNDGWKKDYYLDSKTYLIMAMRKAMPLHTRGPDIESLSTYADYRRVAGVLYPHTFVEKNLATGQVMNSLEWSRIEANVEIEDADFSPPATGHAL